ncbi:hypothetical protein AXG93_2278s1610 [Marchantia polymorpha subsp. ruderalis]|uniref:RRM domain-containing protein n=1 Tax=Marchantia polymorpha subsp. ruderalis TaxID=1480154 RepID=A0A176WFT9_MARPO|nr:hypothetical protein AXG93_2278s1610 [Marchantia polymorpha subsp. ruderalis]
MERLMQSKQLQRLLWLGAASDPTPRAFSGSRADGACSCGRYKIELAMEARGGGGGGSRGRAACSAALQNFDKVRIAYGTQIGSSAFRPSFAADRARRCKTGRYSERFVGSGRPPYFPYPHPAIDLNSRNAAKHFSCKRRPFLNYKSAPGYRTPSRFQQKAITAGPAANIVKARNGVNDHVMPKSVAEALANKVDSLGLPSPTSYSSTLCVAGLPRDCSAREVAHIFRPFRGFKHVELVLPGGFRGPTCAYAHFENFSCAAAVLRDVDGYKFDEKNSHQDDFIRLSWHFDKNL